MAVKTETKKKPVVKERKSPSTTGKTTKASGTTSTRTRTRKAGDAPASSKGAKSVKTTTAKATTSKATTKSAPKKTTKAPAPKKSASTRKAPVKAAPEPKVVEYTPEGFEVGTDIALIAAALTQGGIDRAEVNQNAIDAVAKHNGLKTRTGRDKYIPSQVSAILTRMLNTGEWQIEASWQLVPVSS